MDLFSKSSDIHNGVSGHIETVVLLSKGEINSKKVRVEFSFQLFRKSKQLLRMEKI